MAVNAKVASAYVDLVARTAQFEQALDSAKASARKFSREAAAEMHEAKGSIVLLGEEVGIHLPRHLQTFVAKLPGVTEAMSAAFNAVAVIALITVVVEAGEKLEAFIKKNEDAAKKNAEMWAATEKAQKLSNDELDLSNVKLENQLAKLQHKPENKVAEALLEATVQAEHLSEKLQTAIGKYQDLLKAQAPDMMAQFLDGKSGIGYEQTMLGEHRRHMAEVTTPEDMANESESWRKSLVTRRNELVAMDAMRSSYQDADGRTIPLGSAALRMSNQHGSEIDVVSELLKLQQPEAHSIEATQLSGTLQRKIGGATEQNEAAKERLKAFEEELARQKQLYGMSVAQERSFWEDKLAAFVKGSEQYRAVEQKFFQASAAVSKQFEAIRHRTIGENEAAPVMRFDEQARGADVLTAAIARHAEVVAQLNAQWAEARDRQLVLVGAMKEHAAAIDIAAIHTKDYEDKLHALEAALASLRAENEFAMTIGAAPDPQNLAKQEAVKTQMDQLGGQYRIQQMQDALRVTDTTWKGMIGDVFGELEHKATQTMDHVREIALHFVDSMNTELARGAVGGKMDFRRVFQDAGQGLFKTGLEKLEGSVLGSKANPMYTRDADSITAGAGGGLAKSVGGGLLGFLNDSNFFSVISSAAESSAPAGSSAEVTRSAATLRPACRSTSASSGWSALRRWCQAALLRTAICTAGRRSDTSMRAARIRRFRDRISSERSRVPGPKQRPRRRTRSRSDRCAGRSSSSSKLFINRGPPFRGPCRRVFVDGVTVGAALLLERNIMPMITIAAVTLQDWQGNASGISLLIYTNADFTAQSGNIHPKSAQSNPASLGTFYKSVPCTADDQAATLAIPQVQLDSTVDSPDNPGATYSAVIFDTVSGKPVQAFGTKESFDVPADPVNTSWATIFTGEASE